MRLNIETEGECEGPNVSYMCHRNGRRKSGEKKSQKNRSLNKGLFPSPI